MPPVPVPPQEAPQAVSFNDQVNVLSLVHHREDYKLTEPRPAAQWTYNRHPDMRMLDRISLLLVTRGSHDVGAISVVRSPQTIALYYSKNEPCSQQERTYIEGILRTVVTAATQPEPSKGKCRTEVLRSVLPNCSVKIKSRMNKISIRLNHLHKCLGHYRIVVDNYTADVDASFRKLVPDYFFPKTETLRQFLTRMFDDIRINMAKTVPDEESFGTLIRLSWAIAMTPNIHFVIDEVLLSRIRKLGEYELAIRMLVNEIFDLRNIKEYSITIEEVVSPKSIHVNISAHPATVINGWSKLHDTKIEITPYLLLDVFPHIKAPSSNLPDQPSQREIPAFQHCECTIALYLLRKYSHCRKGPKIGIGMSKSSCWMCQLYLGALLKEKPGAFIIVTSFTGKVRPGWMIPETSSLSVKREIHERMSRFMSDVLECVLRKHQSNLRLQTAVRAVSYASRDELMEFYTQQNDWQLPSGVIT